VNLDFEFFLASGISKKNLVVEHLLKGDRIMRRLVNILSVLVLSMGIMPAE